MLQANARSSLRCHRRASGLSIPAPESRASLVQAVEPAILIMMPAVPGSHRRPAVQNFKLKGRSPPRLP